MLATPKVDNDNGGQEGPHGEGAQVSSVIGNPGGLQQVYPGRSRVAHPRFYAVSRAISSPKTTPKELGNGEGGQGGPRREGAQVSSGIGNPGGLQQIYPGRSRVAHPRFYAALHAGSGFGYGSLPICKL